MEIKSFENFKDFKDAITGLAPGDVCGVYKAKGGDNRWRIVVSTYKSEELILPILCPYEITANEAYDETLRCIPANRKEIESLRERAYELEKANTVHVTDIGILRQQVRDLRANMRVTRWGLITDVITWALFAVIVIMQIL